MKTRKINNKRRVLKNLDLLSNLSSYINEASKIHNKQNNSSQLRKNKRFITSNISKLEDNDSIKSYNKKNLSQSPKSERMPTIKSRLYNTKVIEKNFNIIQKVREIKKITNSNEQRNKHLIVYSPENFDLVFESRNLINKFKTKKENKFDNRNLSINQFYKDTKSNSMNNLIIKLLRSESEKLKVLEREKTMKLEYKENDDILKEKQYKEYSLNQNKLIRKLEDNINLIQEKYRELLIKLKNEENRNRILHDELFKELTQIEELRIYAEFINNALNGSIKFNNEIVDTKNFYSNKNKNNSIDLLVDNCLKNYNFLIKENNKKEENETFEIVKEPEILIRKINQIEKNIIKSIDIHLIIQKENKKSKEEYINDLNELKEHIKFYKKEYNIYEENYKNLLEEQSKISKKQTNENEYIIDFLNELYDFTLKNNTDENLILNNNPIKIGDKIKEIIKKIKNDERRINNYLSIIHNYEIEDPTILNLILTETKLYNKKKKLIESKLNIEEQFKLKIINTQKKNNKIIIQYKKFPEAPFRLIKKIKKEDIDKDKKKEKENIDLIHY